MKQGGCWVLGSSEPAARLTPVRAAARMAPAAAAWMLPTTQQPATSTCKLAQPALCTPRRGPISQP